MKKTSRYLVLVMALLLAAAFVPTAAGAASNGSSGTAASWSAPKPPKAPKVPTGLKPTKIAMHGHGKVFDVRHMKPVKQLRVERPEPPEPLNLAWNPLRRTEPGSLVRIPATAAPAPPPSLSFDGLDFATWGAGHPPDTNGDVGPTYYIETVNTSIGIFDKSTGTLVSAFTFNTFMSQGNFGNLCDTNNFGDPVVLYDTFENRWVITDFAFTLNASGQVINPPGSFQCIAVSKTGDPVSGGWNFYSINTAGGLGDYPKFGIWPDGLYMSTNMFNYAGTSFLNPRVYAFNKAQMYAGSPTVQVLSFDAPSADFTILPGNARLQAGTPPAGTPEYFASTWEFTNALTIYKLHADWAHPSLSTFTGPDTPLAATAWPNAAVANAPSQGGNNLDVLQIRAMVQNQYSNIGGVESLWLSHTVRRGNTAGFAAPRYYQVNVTGGTVNANLPQAATWDPDGANVINRFMPSVAVDRVGDLAMGYSTSSSTTKPAIKYAGRLAADPVNTFSQTEQLLIQGTGTQTGTCGPSTCIRWGDYSSMTLDPDGCTFWYANEYYAVDGLNDLTRIGSFSYPSCTPVGAGGTLSGTVTSTAGGAPIPNATVSLGSRTTTTDGSGNYSFTGLPAGTYTAGMTASQVGFGDGTAGTEVITDGGTTMQNFALTPSPQSGCLTDTSQTDFQRGTFTSCDVVTSPGDVILSKPSLDQVNTNLGNSGVGITVTTWGGQTFTPAVSGQLTSANVNLFCSGCTGTTPNLTLSVRATSGGLPTGADLASATITGFSSGAAVFYSAVFGSPPSLTTGTQYALVIRPTANPSPGTYALTRSGSSTAGADVYAGGTRVAGATSGTVWSIPLTGGVSTDAGFRTFMDSGFASTGSLVSGVFDANPAPGSTPTWPTLSWTASTPTGTSVQFQVAGSNNPNGPFTFVGPDGTAGTFFTTSGASLSPQFDGFRYLKYEAFLATTNSSVTPTLNDVTVCFQDIPKADLVTTVTHTPSRVEIGRPFSYAIQVKNNGPAPAQSVHLTDVLPASMTFVSSSVTGGLSCAALTPGVTGTVDCTLATLASGSTASITVRVRPTMTGPIDDTADVTSTTVDPNPGDESDTESITVQTNSKGCTIVGTGGDDTLTGTAGSDVICGMAGADHIDGMGGNDSLYGQAGNDTLVDHSGLDRLRGGPGNDSLDVADGASGDFADGQGGTDTCTSDVGDTVTHCP